VAVIVNDLGSINIDGQAVQQMGLDQEDEKVVELQNGCMCCGLKDDLLREIRDIAKSGKYDVLLVEGSGVAEPMPVAEGIANFDIGRGSALDACCWLSVSCRRCRAVTCLPAWRPTR
jgi:G3E family GTPase